MVALVLPPTLLLHYSSLSASPSPSPHNSALFPPSSLSNSVHLRRWRSSSSIPTSPPAHVALFSSSSYPSFFASVSIFRDANGTGLSCSASRRSEKGRHEKRSGTVVGVAEGGDEDGRDKEMMGLGKKPRGFGEGKIYDVSLEEELLKEMEQNRRKKQVSNGKSLKSSRNGAALVSSQKKTRKETKVNGVMSKGVRVRIGNLPKKKNIHRDLKLAFDKFAGITNISPAVSGNHKTRDPICKGFAFVDFKTEDVAERFSRTYSNQSLKFGKVEKNITCHVINPPSSLVTSVEESSGDESSHIMSNTNNPSLEHLPGKERKESEERYSIIDASVSSSDVIEKLQSEAPSADFSSLEEESLEQTSGELVDGHSIQSEHMSSNGQAKSKTQKKKQSKQKKGTHHNTLGSANRLKGKERIIFSETFSKYGGKVAPDSAKN